MPAYLRVMLSVGVVTMLLVLAVIFLHTTDAQAVISVVLVVVALGDIVSTAYLANVLLTGDNRRLWVSVLMFTTATVTTVSTLTIGYVVARRFLGLPALEGQLGLLIVGIGVVIGSATPIIKALVMFLVRHGDADEDHADVAA